MGGDAWPIDMTVQEWGMNYRGRHIFFFGYKIKYPFVSNCFLRLCGAEF